MQLRNCLDYLSYETAQFKTKLPVKLNCENRDFWFFLQLDAPSLQKSWAEH